MIPTGKLRGLALALLSCLSLAANASAQITTGTVAGTVKDAQGGVIPGATVVLVSETKGTKSAPVVTQRSRRLRVSRTSRRTPTPSKSRWKGSRRSRRTGVQVSGGDRVALGNQTIEVGGAAETVNVTAEAALVQSQSGERSFAVTTTQVANLPINHANFTSLTALAPGVVSGGASAGGTRLGGAGQNNIMMDGVSAMDTGNNGQMLNMNIESIAEVKILTQGYQAEYGRSSGLQITAVTKSGTNQFRGSAYDVQTDSDWNANTWVNDKNGDAKPKSSTKTLGYSLGGPVGKPGGTNKLFFFYSHEYRPTTAPINNGNPIRLRVPTALERAGDFSQTLDNNGVLFNLIKTRARRCLHGREHGRLLPGRRRPRPDPGQPALRGRPRGAEPVSAAERRRRPRARTTTTRFRAAARSTNLTQQPAIRLDYQFSSKLRFTGKYSGPARAQARHARDDPRLQRRAEPVPVHYELRRRPSTTR